MGKSSIFKELYEKDIIADRKVSDPRYGSLSREVLEGLDALRKKIGEEDGRTLDRLICQCGELGHMEKEEAFASGFCLGARLFCEIYGDDGCV